MERTLVLIKPDGVRRGLVGEVLSRFERKGFQILRIVFGPISEFVAQKHYEEHKDKPQFPRLVDHLTSGPCVIIVLEGENVIERVREMMGPWKNPPAGTIRGDLGQEVPNNVIHGSDSVESAKREIKLYFGEI